MAVKLNFGCGKKKMDGFINTDINLRSEADLIFDLNHVKYYPFKDETSDYIWMDNVIEHLDDVIQVLGECHRILKKGGVLELRVPYWLAKGAHEDPTHKHTFSEKSFDFLKEGFITDFYTDLNFDVNVERIWGFGSKYKILRRIIGDDLATCIPNSIIGLIFTLEKRG